MPLGKEWTPDDISILNSAWADGMLASEIGIMLGRTPASVVGKAHATGLSSRRRGKKSGFVMPPEQRELIGEKHENVLEYAQNANCDGAKCVMIPALKDGASRGGSGER